MSQEQEQLPLLLPELQPQLQPELQPQPQVLPQELPQLVVQQGLQQALATKSGNVIAQRLEEQELQELQAMENPPKKMSRKHCFHDILCAGGGWRHIQLSKIIVSSRLAVGFGPRLPSGRSSTSSSPVTAPFTGGTGQSLSSCAMGLVFFFFIQITPGIVYARGKFLFAKGRNLSGNIASIPVFFYNHTKGKRRKERFP